MITRKLIYFAQGAGGGGIKVGHSEDVTKRITALQVGYPDKLVVLFTHPESIWLNEQRVLHFFRPIKLNGEWLSPHPFLLHFIGLLNAGHHDAARKMLDRRHVGNKDALYEIEIEYWKKLARDRGKKLRQFVKVTEAFDAIDKIAQEHELYCDEEDEPGISDMAYSLKSIVFDGEGFSEGHCFDE